MITFKTLRYKNLFSTGNIFTEVQLNRASSTLVIGQNGAGKSTMIDALTFALFGKPFRNVNKPDIVNSINGRDCVVEVEFSVGHREYKVVRGVSPNIFEIHQDGHLMDQTGAAKDYQSILEKQILRFNYKAFTQIVILSAASFVPFMQLQAHDRRAIIEDLLDIQIFSAMNVILKNRMIGNKMTSDGAKTKQDAVKTKIELHAKYVQEARKSTSESIGAKEQTITDSNEQIAKLEKDIGLVQRHIDQLEATIKDQTDVKDKLKQYHTYETQIEGNKRKKEKDRAFYLDNDNCPTCRQDLAAEFKKANLEKANSAIVQFDTALQQLEANQNKYNERLTEIQATVKKMVEHGNELSRLRATKEQIRRYVRTVEIEVAELKSKPVLSEDMTKVSTDLVDDLESQNAEIERLREEKRHQDLIASLLKDSGIKAKIIKQYLPIINKLVNKYLTSMDFFVNFEVDEEFRESIKSRFRDNFSYGNFSEGEKLRIDLALLFAWRAVAKIKNSMNTNLLILDEVFDSSMDNAGTEEFMKLIKSFTDMNIFIISHKSDILVDKFEHTLRFVKKNNFSQIDK